MAKYSQNNEQEHIVSYFNQHPKCEVFLEIGSFDPKVFSNTRALVEMGYDGVYVEPSRICFDKFVDEYGEKDNILLLNYAITNFDGKVKFFDSNGDAISSTSAKHKKIWEDGYPTAKFTEVEVDAMSMDTLLNEYGGNIDFLNLDVESTNIELFNLIPDWFWERLQLLCIEHDGQIGHITNTLQKFGFKEIHRNGENLILGK